MLVQLEVSSSKYHEVWLALIVQPQPQSLTNELASYPGTPAQPSNCGDKVRFVLGVILPDRPLSATALCV